MQNEQLWALHREYPGTSRQMTRGKNFFKEIAQGRVSVRLKRVYILDDNNIPRALVEKELEMVLARLFRMRLIACDASGVVYFTIEWDEIEWLKKLLNFQNI